MNSGNQIKHIRHKNIDSAKWNSCIEKAANSRFYANEWHLDRTAIEWDALVWGNYEYVMPLPIRKKWGIEYIYQPLFCQQLGIFPEPSISVAQQFYLTLYNKFRFVETNLNSTNPPIEKNPPIAFSPRMNHLLLLSNSYTSIAAEYNSNTKRNIAKAEKSDLQLIAGIRLEDYLAFKKKQASTQFSDKEFKKLKSIIAFGQYKGMGEIYGVYDNQNHLRAAVYFCRWKDRVIYLNAASDEQGKELRAMFFLLDQFIKMNAGKNVVLDFEGSMIPGVARFYEGFGALPETYFQLKFNRLPLLLKLIKH
jgi:hypothetical protein